MVTNGLKISQVVGNGRECSQTVADGHKRSQMFQMLQISEMFQKSQISGVPEMFECPLIVTIFWVSKSLLLRMKCVIDSQDFQIFCLKLNKYYE